VSGVQTLILRGTRGGTFAIPRDWTDHAAPSATGEESVINAHSLPSLLELTKRLKTTAENRKKKSQKGG